MHLMVFSVAGPDVPQRRLFLVAHLRSPALPSREKSRRDPGSVPEEMSSNLSNERRFTFAGRVSSAWLAGQVKVVAAKK
jgi:hypothetical protein